MYPRIYNAFNFQDFKRVAVMAQNYLDGYICASKVSSVLNNDVKSYGKQNLFDGSVETCWNSDKGSPQFIALKFSQSISLSGFEIMFQGGFAAQQIQVGDEIFHPEDSNQLQRFTFKSPIELDRIQFIFSESRDWFGRITVYQLHIF
jgi:hypothetical protein